MLTEFRRMKGAGWAIAVVFSIILLATVVCANTTVTLWYWNWAGMDRAMKRIVPMFEAQNPGITVETAGWGSPDQLIVRTLSGTPPDVVVTQEGHLGQFVSEGIILPLNSLIDATPEVKDGLVPQAWRGIAMNEQYWFIPGIEWGPRDGFAWNKTFFDEAGLPGFDPDKAPSWDLVAEYNAKLAQRNVEGEVTRVGYHPAEGRNGDIYVWEFALGACWWDAAEERIRLNTAAFTDALQYLFDRFIAPYSTEFIGLRSWYVIAQGRTAMANLGYYAPGQLRSRASQWDFRYTWHPTMSGQRATALSGWGYAIPAGAQKDEAWKLITFLVDNLEAQQIIYEETGYFPASTKFFSEFRSADPGMNWFANAVNDTEWAVPEDNRPSWGVGIVHNALGDVMSQVYGGKAPAKTALDSIQSQVDAQAAQYAQK